MREIKFRMYEKKTKKMYDVERINFKDHLLNMWNSRFYSSSLFNFKDVELMQFTGLHDKNGKEIYEGDIVKATYEFENNETSSEIGVVKNKIHKFILENRQKYEFEIEYFDYLEVIGNVWDNPELLERS